MAEITLEEARQFFEENFDVNIPQRGLPCQLEGILESVCVPKESKKEELQFCYPYL